MAKKCLVRYPLLNICNNPGGDERLHPGRGSIPNHILVELLEQPQPMFEIKYAQIRESFPLFGVKVPKYDPSYFAYNDFFSPKTAAWDTLDTFQQKN